MPHVYKCDFPFSFGKQQLALYPGNAQFPSFNPSKHVAQLISHNYSITGVPPLLSSQPFSLHWANTITCGQCSSMLISPQIIYNSCKIYAIIGLKNLMNPNPFGLPICLSNKIVASIQATQKIRKIFLSLQTYRERYYYMQ